MGLLILSTHFAPHGSPGKLELHEVTGTEILIRIGRRRQTEHAVSVGLHSDSLKRDRRLLREASFAPRPLRA